MLLLAFSAFQQKPWPVLCCRHTCSLLVSFSKTDHWPALLIIRWASALHELVFCFSFFCHRLICLLSRSALGQC